MKRFICYIFILFANCSFAQLASVDSILLQKAIRDKRPEGNIVYTDKINESDLYQLFVKLKDESFRGATTDTKMNVMTISKQERKDLEKKLKNLSKPYWQSQLFTDSKMIQEQNVMVYYKSVYQEYSETFTNPNNTQQDKSQLLMNTPQPYVFEFSPPVYFRDNFCFIYMKTFCGNGCGSTEMSFYKKQDDKWEKFVVLAVN
jgi:hypothetical protein